MSVQNDAGTREKNWHKSDTADSMSVLAENENPGTLAGVTGAEKHVNGITGEEYRKRVKSATVLCLAITECEPEDACIIMEAALMDLGAGQPRPPLFSVMEEATHWADFASVAELKAYALACFNRMPGQVKRAFLAHVGRAN